MNVLQAISDWVRAKDPWFSDAVRRIFMQANLSVQDEDAILRNLYSHYGVLEAAADEPNILPFVRVTESPPGTAPRVILKEIHSLQHVNALVPDQSIQFALDGMTVIYGENGAGKSGYARVLKHACFARDKSDVVKPNVLVRGDHTPQAIIEFERDGDARAFRWRATAPSLEDLTHVAVFDSHCARVFVDAPNEVEYLPYGMDTFPRLGDLFTRLSTRIGKELESLGTDVPTRGNYDPATVAGRLVHGLSESTSVDDVRALAQLSEAQQGRLNQLREICQRAALESPRVRAQELRNRKRRFEQLSNDLQQILTVLSPERRRELQQLATEHELAQQAAELAAQTAFGGEPLRGSGTEPWRFLFQAARKFSETEAYPKQPFPVIDDGALCVLCQQLLDAPSRDRLRRFDDFVRDTAAKRRDQALGNLRAAIDTVDRLDVGAVQSNAILLEELATANLESAGLVTSMLTDATRLKAAIVADAPNWSEVVEAGDFCNPMIHLTGLMEKLSADAAELERSGEPDTLAQQHGELRELEDRVRLRADLETIEKMIRDKRRAARLKRCREALGTGPITRFSSDLMTRLVTNELDSNLRDELSHYDATFPQVTMQRLGQKGKTKHKMVVGESDKPSGILSEGEQRVIAIAAFLAELKTAKSHSPIIFDDPVSSLDHRYRERVAERLVAESKVRQVIVFTNDVVLLLKLQKEAGDRQIPLRIQTIARSAGRPGNCMPSNELPWPACNTKTRIDRLKVRMADLKKLHTANSDEYPTRVADFYNDLRETWERAIEELLLNDVIQRFRPSIETTRLKRVLIELGDYPIIDKAMSKCSTFMKGHDKSPAINLHIPSPAEVVQDLDDVEQFKSLIMKRGDKTRELNATLCEAPLAKVACKESRAATVMESAPFDGHNISEQFA